jgi:3-oxoacyl-[acyl-carrier protein] reductase
MNKILFITGASSDVGTALIRNVANNYNVVLAHYCHWNNQLEQLKNDFGNKIYFYKSDFFDLNSIQEMIATIKNQQLEPDHIVHFPSPKMLTQKFIKTNWSQFEDGWEMSMHSAVTILQAFIPHMQKQKYGKIILMLTSCTLDMPPKYQTAYTTVKYALLGLMKSLATEYASKGITINGVSPDMIQTKFLSNLPGLIIEQYAESRPQKQILKVDDVIPTFAFLLSDGADNINGMNIGIQ